jgi:hypothetical protein
MHGGLNLHCRKFHHARWSIHKLISSDMNYVDAEIDFFELDRPRRLKFSPMLKFVTLITSAKAEHWFSLEAVHP